MVGLISPTHKTETNVRNFGKKNKNLVDAISPQFEAWCGVAFGRLDVTHTHKMETNVRNLVGLVSPKTKFLGSWTPTSCRNRSRPSSGDVSSLPTPSSSASAGLSRSTSWARRSMRAPTPRLMATCGGRSRVAAPPGERLGEAGAARPVPPLSPCLRRRRVRAVHDCSRGHQGRLRGGRLRPRVQNRQVLWRAARGPRHAQVQFFPRIAAKEVWGDL